LLRLRLVAPVTDHLRVALPPLVTQEGLALKLWMTGIWSAGGALDEPPQAATAIATQATLTPQATARRHLPMSVSNSNIHTQLTTFILTLLTHMGYRGPRVISRYPKIAGGTQKDLPECAC